MKSIARHLAIAGLALLPFSASRGGDDATPDPDVPDARSPAGKLLFDFRAPKAFEGWIVVNDNVMGGRSEGGFERGDEGLVFSGRTNTDGGGFSSIRGPLPRQAELGKADGLTLRLRATGNRTFKVDLRQVESGRRSSLAYRADIPLAGHGDWEEVRVPFAAFAGSWRGERVHGATLEPEQVTHLGLFIYDGQDGPFRLEIDHIATYRNESDAKGAF